ncbi:MAG: DUF5906 domain-containing protein [Alphaproteobacteria bacterium]|nr:DUF5906 domain-containing protein [Alphaproteobacteria bacterium]
MNDTKNDYYDRLSIPEKILKSAKPLLEPTEYLKKRGIHTLKVNNLYILEQDFKDTYNSEEVKIFKGCYIIPIYKKNELVNIQYITSNNSAKMFLKGHIVKGGYCKFFVNDNVEQFFLVEGVYDALSLNLVGQNAICTFNADNMVASSIEHYEEWNFKGNVFADNDDAGSKAGTKASSILGTQILMSPNKKQKDVNDLLLVFGEKYLAKLITDFLSESYLGILNLLRKKEELKIVYNLAEEKLNVLFFSTKYESQSQKRIGYRILNTLKDRKLLYFSSTKAEIMAKEVGKYLATNSKEVVDVNYFPNKPYFTTINKGGEIFLNTYQPSGLKAKKDLKKVDYIHLKNYLVHILGDTGNLEYYNWFIELLAWKWQHPEIKYEYIPIFTGDFGTGKSTIGKILYHLFGKNTNLDVSEKHFIGDFNKAFENKLICMFDETPKADKKYDIYNKIKSLTGNETLSLNNKNKDEKDNYNNFITFILTSNEEYPYQLEEHDRRAVIFKQNHIPDKEYFNKLYSVLGKECEGFAYDLEHYKLGNRLPLLYTKYREELKQLSRNHIDLFVDELAENYSSTIQEINNIYKMEFPYSFDFSTEKEINGFYLGIKKDDNNQEFLCLSTNLFTNLVNKKFSQNAKNSKFIYSMARKNKKFQYETSNNFIINYYRKNYRVVKIRLNESNTTEY